MQYKVNKRKEGKSEMILNKYKCKCKIITRYNSTKS